MRPSFAFAKSRAGTLATLLVAVGALGGAACYNPTIKGPFKCNTDYLPGHGDCPEGYHCSDGLCVKGSGGGARSDGGADASADRPSMETHAEVGVEVAPEVASDAPPEGPACYEPVQGCTPDPSKTCDPVCQTGCGCHEKCSSITTGTMAGTLTCNVPVASRPRMLGEDCDQASAGSAMQTDDCAPGLVCLEDACSARCYKFCNTDADCPMSTCTKDVGGGVKVCDVQAVTCNPINNGMPTGCPSDNQGCYVSTTGTDRTICDCEFMGGRSGSSCTIERDCLPGLACVAVGGSSMCRPACSLAAGATDCVATTCTPIRGSTKFGFCN